MTVTRVRARWLLAWSGERPATVEPGDLVFRGDRVLHADGPYEGRVDVEIDASDALVAPGFVNLHVHAGALAAGRAYDDAAGPSARRLGFLQYGARGRDEDAPAAASPADLAAAARWTVAELLRSGITTAVEIGGETGVPPAAMLDAGAELGLRLVVGKGFRSRDYVRTADGRVGYAHRGDGGTSAFREALALAEALLERDDPMVGAMLFPLQIDTCSPDLLREAYAAADVLGIPMQIHGAQTPFELETLARERGQGPVEALRAAGALGPRTLLAHAILLDHHSWRRGVGARPERRPEPASDLARLADAGAGVVHCPVAMARRGLALESYGRYRRAGVPVAIGTDTYPRDLLAEARLALYLSRVVDRRAADPTAADAFASVTHLAADMIDRPDLGRLAPGARADFQVVDLARYRTGPVRDPLSTWFHAGVAENVRSVWVAGEARVHDGVVRNADRDALVARRQAAGDAAWT